MAIRGPYRYRTYAARVGDAFAHHRRHRFGIADAQGKRDARIARPVAMHQWRKPVIANGLTGREPERAAFETRDVGEHVLRRGSTREHRSRLNEEQPAGRR